jgi:hypothetical protein
MNGTDFNIRTNNLLIELQLIKETIKGLPGYMKLKSQEVKLKESLLTLTKEREYYIKEEESDRRLQLLSPYGELRQVDSFYIFVLNGCPSISHLENNISKVHVFPEEARKYVLGIITRDKRYCLKEALDCFLNCESF